MTTRETMIKGAAVQEANRRNLRHVLRSFEPQDLGQEIAEALRENLGSGRAGTIVLDALSSMKGVKNG